PSPITAIAAMLRATGLKIEISEIRIYLLSPFESPYVISLGPEARVAFRAETVNTSQPQLLPKSGSSSLGQIEAPNKIFGSHSVSNLKW
ncbi:MAG: hypothetical protein ABR568_20670, partial [Pyrinomonadaceae bacterium]